jgi:hypothetical protein
MRTIKIYFKRAPFYNALIRRVELTRKPNHPIRPSGTNEPPTVSYSLHAEIECSVLCLAHVIKVGAGDGSWLFGEEENDFSKDIRDRPSGRR